VIRYLALVRPFKRIFILGKGEQRAGELAALLRTMPEFRGRDVCANANPAGGGLRRRRDSHPDYV